MSWVRTDQCILQTLVVALGMIMRDEFGNRFPHRPFAEQDHPLQAGFLDGPYEPFGVGVGEKRALQTVVILAEKFSLSRILSIR